MCFNNSFLNDFTHTDAERHPSTPHYTALMSAIFHNNEHQLLTAKEEDNQDPQAANKT